MRPVILKWGLLASVVLNAFLLGLGSHLLDDRHDRPPPPPDPNRMIEQMVAVLSPADGAVMRRAFDAERDNLQAAHHDPSAMHRQIHDALLAEPFDPARLQAVFAAEDQGHAAMGAAVGRMLAQAASQMSPEGRHRLADFRPGPPGPPPPP